MHSGKIPFRFDTREIVARAARLTPSIDGVSINLPFLSINLKATDIDCGVAREVVIRLADKRVLNASECCDNCITEALASLQEIRAILVNAQVQLKDRVDGPLYLVLETMLIALRQFLTFEQRLSLSNLEDRQIYFDALELLRGHLYRCLDQVARIAAISIPEIREHMRYGPNWLLSAYEPPETLPRVSSERGLTTG